MSFACLALVTIPGLGCGSSEEPQAHVVHLAVTPPADESCIGVSGFELELIVGDEAPRTAFVARSRPVLDRDHCVLDRPTTFGDIDLDATVRVQVRGYDGARQLRVQGIASFISLRADLLEPVRLEAADKSSLPVVAIDRNRDLLMGAALEEVATIELSMPGTSKLVVVVDDENRGYFFTGEPWAVAYPSELVAGDTILAKAVLSKGTVLNQKLRLEASEGGNYFLAIP